MSKQNKRSIHFSYMIKNNKINNNIFYYFNYKIEYKYFL